MIETKTNFDPANFRLTPELCMDIVTLFNAWAAFENALAMWLIALMNVDDDIGRVIIDRYDTRAKIDRIKEIYAHLHNDQMVTTVKDVGKKFETWVTIRNTVAHKLCFGISIDQTHIMFSTGKYVKGNRGEIQMIGIDVSDFKKCANFAIQTAKQIMDQLPPPKEPS